MNMVRVNVTQGTVEMEHTDSRYPGWAGRGLIAKVLQQEVPPTCSPLGPENKLILANGLLAGLHVACAGRLSVGGKSPLTGGAKEANAGGTAGDAMARVGVRAVIVEGQPDPDRLFLLHIGDGKPRLVPADKYRRLGTFDLCRQLYEEFGRKVAVICIGPAGELGLGAAGVAVSDAEGFPTRYAARGGVGALMGSKGLKAVVIEQGRSSPPIHDKAGFRRAVQAFHACLVDNPHLASFKELGTAYMFNSTQFLGGAPVRNFSAGQFEGFPQTSPEALRDTIKARGGEGRTGHHCMPGCLVKCSNVFPDEHGKAMASPIEYESLALLGPNLGISSLDTIARLTHLCNDIGLDTIETGCALGVAMEAGVIPFDDGEGAERLITEIAEGTLLGRVIGHGAVVAGKVLGVKRVPAAKGQGMGAYDPRGVKGFGVTYATSPMGADHTAGHTMSAQVDHHLKEGQVEASRRAQILRAGQDTVNLCSFAGIGIVRNPEILSNLCNAVWGTNHEADFTQELGKEVLRTERAFNIAAGFTPAHDRLPDFFYTEKLPPFDLVFDVPDKEIEGFYDF